MTSEQKIDYFPRDNIQASARPLGELIDSGEATIAENGDITSGDRVLLEAGKYRVEVDPETLATTVLYQRAKKD